MLRPQNKPGKQCCLLSTTSFPKIKIWCKSFICAVAVVKCQSVSMFIHHSDDLSSYPAEVCRFYSLKSFGMEEYKQKEAGDGPFR